MAFHCTWVSYSKFLNLHQWFQVLRISLHYKGGCRGWWIKLCCIDSHNILSILKIEWLNSASVAVQMRIQCTSLTLQIQGHSWLGKTFWIDGLLCYIWMASVLGRHSYSQAFHCQVNDHCAIGILGYTKSNHKWLTVQNKLLQTNKLPYSHNFAYGNSIVILFNFWENKEATLLEEKNK